MKEEIRKYTSYCMFVKLIIQDTCFFLFPDEGLSLEQLSTVTKVVISVMNLSDILQQEREDSPTLQLVENKQNR